MRQLPRTSKVFVGFVETHGLCGVDDEIAGVDVVSLHDHLEDLWLVNCALFHKVNDLVLDRDGVVHIVVQLHLQLVLELSVLLQEVFVIDGICEVFVVLGQQVHLAVVGPGVEAITHGVLRPNAHVLASSQ